MVMKLSPCLVFMGGLRDEAHDEVAVLAGVLYACGCVLRVEEVVFAGHLGQEQEGAVEGWRAEVLKCGFAVFFAVFFVFGAAGHGVR